MMTSSSEMFETLEEELQNLCDMIETRIDNKLVGSPYGESRKKLVNEISRDLAEGQSFTKAARIRSKTSSHSLPT